MMLESYLTHSLFCCSCHLSQNCCHHCSFSSEGLLVSVLLLSVVVVFIGEEGSSAVRVVLGGKGPPFCHAHNVTKPVPFGYNPVVPASIIPSSGASMPVEFV